jgi:polysaccharide biosynthesis protein VpsM
MKHIVRNLSILSCIGSSVFAAPFLAIGDNAELFATGSASAAYNDNLLLSADGAELEDEVFTFVPGFDLQFGKDSLLKGNIAATATLTSYSDFENLNNQLLGVGSQVSYQSGAVSLSGNASFNELDQATVDVLGAAGRLVERDVTAAGINGEVEASGKISVGAGLAYNKVDYKVAGFVDQEDYTVPVNVYYELTPKVDVSTGVTYKNSELDPEFLGVGNATEYDAVYYNVGARGAFTSKLSGAFSVGYNTREANIGPDDDGSFGADASLAYAYTEKTQLTLSLARNYSNSSANGDSYENSQITFGASSALTTDWSVSASATYRQLDYQNIDRSDDYVEATLGASYIINAHLTASASYTIRDQSSDLGAASEFSNNVVALSISARY